MLIVIVLIVISLMYRPWYSPFGFYRRPYRPMFYRPMDGFGPMRGHRDFGHRGGMPHGGHMGHR